jgi:predicted nucleotidyltransferase
MKKTGIVREIDNIKKKIVAACRPQKIILFGSHAYGHPGNESDIDFLVIVPFKGKAAYKAIEILEAVRPTIPVDLIVRTPEQLQTRLSQNDFFLKEVMSKGKVLYEAPH